jgi:hypothetical protein
MRFLPPLTQPRTLPIRRRHKPRRGAFKVYRPCLRWEFGFTCAFCLLHEADICPVGGARGSGLFTIEHGRPQSLAGRLAHRYGNCFYACRYCNEARKAKPNRNAKGERLLNPCTDSWSENFIVDGDQLLPRNANASYTAEAYNLNDPRKRAFRRHRLKLHEEYLELAKGVRQLPAEIAKARGKRQTELLDLLLGYADAWRKAAEDLAPYTLVPRDKDDACRCSDATECRLAPEFSAIGIDLEASPAHATSSATLRQKVE